MNRKKQAPARAHKVKSSGVWIAPDLERKIKGEGGRRGLTEPPYSYYLRLADLVLGNSTPAPTHRPALNASPAKPPLVTSPKRPRPLFPKPAKTQRPKPLPMTQPPKLDKRKPPKLDKPKPSKRPVSPKPSLLKPPKAER